MPSDCISYRNSGYFTPLITDYLDQKENLEPLYNRFPTLENFEKQIAEKSVNYNHSNRTVLAKVLRSQYKDTDISLATAANIASLENQHTFTVTTGHQLNLMTGPLYFLYKIISTINLAKQLKVQYPAFDFVPVYWMATEDHDFDEINFFNFKGKKFRWEHEAGGPVGRMDTSGLDEVLRLFAMELGDGTNAEKIRELFENAYPNNTNLADATRYLANALFGQHGLVILDADSAELKRIFIPYMQRELIHQIAYNSVTTSIERLKEYNIQVNPREINLFYIEDHIRERIVFQDGGYIINNTDIRFNTAEILAELEKHPEKFSPNVITRPLYEEVLLPNLCYIGGGGEIAYWLELKAYFDQMDVTFPILLVRNSVLLATSKQASKADRLNLSWADLFSKNLDLVNAKVRELSEFPIDLSPQKAALQKQFDELHQIALKTDKSFAGAVRAQETKQLRGLENLEKRLLKAQKRKHADELHRITALQIELFPNQGLQERQANFSEFYLQSGETLIERLVTELKPLENEFKILVL